MEASSTPRAMNPMQAVFKVRNFVLLWSGQTTSMLGDAFYGIAAAWLVLQLTGDPLALGTVLAVAGIPRAIFTVIGGAITDRYSPRQVMLIADAIRLVLTAMMSIQVFTGTIQVWMIYVYALVGGIVGGFFNPASMAIVPRLLMAKDLQAGNSLTQGSAQLIGFVGPAVAGAMIAAFNGGMTGVSAALAFDALTFVVSVVTLWLMVFPASAKNPAAKLPFKAVFTSIGEGFQYLFKDASLRLMFLIIAIANMAFGGVIAVGVPYLANTRFVEGAAAYGFIVAGYSAGNLIGIILCGALPRLSKKYIQLFMVVMFVIFGIGVGAMGWIASTWLGTLDLFVMGILNGYIAITLITVLQRSTPPAMMGRLMSMVLLANLSLMPLSQAFAGAILRWNVLALFVISGGLLLALSLYLLIPKNGKTLSDQLAQEETAS
jgi:MFS family permease